MIERHPLVFVPCCVQAAESLESLDMYPAEPEVHKYLLDRLTRVTDIESLYELHYLAITLGKVGGI